MGVGLGFTLLRREVFEAIIKAYPEKHLRRLHPETSPLHPWLYDYLPDGRMGHGSLLGEDYGFCRLWSELTAERVVEIADERPPLPAEFRLEPLKLLPEGGRRLSEPFRTTEFELGFLDGSTGLPVRRGGAEGIRARR